MIVFQVSFNFDPAKEILKILKVQICKNVRFIFKEKMYNTINSYYKYTSIPKSSFYKINIFITPINTGEKYLKYSKHFASICNESANRWRG